MPRRTEKPICPYCKYEFSRQAALGQSGLINQFGMTNTIMCPKCEADIDVEIEVKITFSTKK